MKLPHISVLKDELVNAVMPYLADGGIVLDCTLGFGGHSLAILRSCPKARIYAYDKDLQAINLAAQRFTQSGFKVSLDSTQESKNSSEISVFIRNAAFSNALDFLDSTKLQSIKAIIADIGVSSMQLDSATRGFSFKSSGLDMTMDSTQSLNAQKIINSYSAFELERIFREFGEIRESKKLANIIINERAKKPFTSAMELSECIAKHIKAKHLHPATLAFQALRIEVNNELGELTGLLDSIEKNANNLQNVLVGIISFHSLEDRIIKERFKQWAKSCICEASVYKCQCGGNNALGKILNKKPLIPTNDEIKANPRSRSAKLRLFEIG